MKWEKVRQAFPNQFVLVSILDYHFEGDKKIVDEVAPIRTIKEEDANRAFFTAKEEMFVYHTQNEEFVIRMRENLSLERKRR